MIDALSLVLSALGLLVALVALVIGAGAANKANALSEEIKTIEAERWAAEQEDKTVQAHWANAPDGDRWVWGLVVTNTHARQVTDVEIEVLAKQPGGATRRTARTAVLPPGEWFIPDASKPLGPLPDGIQPLTHAKNYRVGSIRFTDPRGAVRTVGQPL